MTLHPSAFPAARKAGTLAALLLAALPACGARRASPGVLPPPPRAVVLPCAEFATLEPGRPWASSTERGSDAMHGRCVRGDAPACVFALDVPARSDLRIRVESSEFDAALSLLSGPAERPFELACVDDAPVGDLLHARIETTVAPGRYWVVVDSAAGETGSFELFAEVDPLPEPGHACRTARPLTAGHVVRGSTRGGTSDFSATCAGGAEGPDHAYTFEMKERGRVRVRLDSEFDGALSLRSQCDEPRSELACNDEGSAPRESLLTAELEPGRYHAIVDSFSRGQSGDYTLSLEQAPLPPARSLAQVCDEVEALPVEPGYHELDTLHEPSLLEGSCGGGGAPERALSFEVTRPSTLRASLERPELNAVIYVLRSCRDEASELSCFEAPPLDRVQSLPDPLGVRRGGERPAISRELVRQLEPGRYTLVVDGRGPGEVGAAGLRFSLE
jgi:hypothetical protein